MSAGRQSRGLLSKEEGEMELQIQPKQPNNLERRSEGLSLFGPRLAGHRQQRPVNEYGCLAGAGVVAGLRKERLWPAVARWGRERRKVGRGDSLFLLFFFSLLAFFLSLAFFM